jgi:hypothetical protein
VLGARGGGATKLLHAPREPVAFALELGEVRQPRRPRGTRQIPATGRGDVREAGRDDARQLALHARYLRLQSHPGGALGGLGREHPVEDKLLLQLRHLISSRADRRKRGF